ncbi:MAG: aminoglycoside phosphotransferase family protein [Anaerolineae bacterium]|nr:aminoglycoside phosphotransferase family protein [Anaerolineae bacterium]
MTFAAETLTELVLAHLDADPRSLRFAPVSTGKHNTSFWVDSDRGRFVLRIAPPDDAGFLFYERLMMHQEPDLHALIRARTRIPVAEVVGYDFGRTRIERDYLLMSALPGTPLSDVPGLTRAQFDRALEQVGQYLRQLHALTAGEHLESQGYGYLGAHRPMEPQPTWAAAFRVMWDKLLDDVVACGSYTTEEARVLRDLLELHIAHFERPVGARLLHMDVWSQNILVDGAGNVSGLVDFDRALWGDVEIEFAVLDYCGISEPPFWEGYGAERDTSPSAMIRRQFYLLYEVQKYMPIRVWRRNNPADAARYKQQSLALAAQLLPGR